MTEQKKEEVVISGIGGCYPECDNLDELKELLFNKMNGVTLDSRRWEPNELGVVAGTGKIKNVDKFDATFFSVHPKLAEVMDAMTRIFIEKSTEAVFDAGLSTSDLYETNTAVFAGSAISETEMFTLDASKTAAFSMLGRSRTMQANRVSYILNLNGPSFSMDGGWICGSNGLEKAKAMIENGVISSAIVGVTNLVLRPEIQFQFQGLNRLNRSVLTKPFSSNADGYNRSEACIVMFLQKASAAKRSYGTLLSVKSMQFGNHQGHITDHEGKHFKSLLLDSYREADIDPATVDYVEAYGSGIKTDDSMELNVMEEVFCTKRRKTPLKVGSVKSNLGHCEASGLFMSIVKSIIALDGGYIPPTINYTEPNENVAALKNGSIRVITDKTPLVGDVVGVNSFGFLNSFSHVILKRNIKVKNNINQSVDYILPRLILVSGRNEENVRGTINKIKSYGNDTEFIALTNNVFSKNINAHFYRSFSIYPSIDDSRIDDVWNFNLKKRPVWFIFSGMGSQWQGMGSDLMKVPIFADAINRCDTILRPKGVDIKDVLSSQDPKMFDNILNSFVGIAAVQIGLVDVLKALDIIPDGIVGHSVGELGCAYADGCFTTEEMILSAYARGRASLETEFIPGMMAAIGLGHAQIKDRLPHDVDVACHNSASSCTISGPVDSINAFISQLKAEGIFAKAVNVSGIAFHSRYIQPAGPTLLSYLKEVIKKPKMRSSKWVSSSVLETEWNSDLAKYSSPEYHTNNLLSSVLFENSLKHIPSDAITIEIAPHGLLQAIIKGALPDTVTNIPLTKKVYGHSVRFLLSAIGKMYMSGLNPKIQELYPPIKFPVSRGTPSIQSLPFWDHNEQRTPIVAMNSKIKGFQSEKTTSIFLNDSIHLIEYRVHGQNIIPLSYILVNVWKMFVEMNGKTNFDEPVQFNNIRFKNNVKIHPTKLSESYIMIQLGSGIFEYNFDNKLILSGQICSLNNTNLEATSEISVSPDQFQGCVFRDEVYSILENNGLRLGDKYKNITYFNVYKNNIQGYVKWNNDWIYFLDGLFKFPLLEILGACDIESPVSIRQISINPSMLVNNVAKDICVNYKTVTKELTCNGVTILDVENGLLNVSKLMTSVTKLEEQIFFHYKYSKCKIIEDFIKDSMDIIMEADKLNFNTGKLVLCTAYHLDDPISSTCSRVIKQILEDQLSINSAIINWDNVKNVLVDDESDRFITVANDNYLQDTKKTLSNKKCSYIIVGSKQKLQDCEKWKIIIQQQLNDNSYLALLKKVVMFHEKPIFIKPNNDDYDLSVWTAIKEYNSSMETIYIIYKSEPLEGIRTHVKHMLLKYKTQKLRFLFILDSNAPNFETHKSFYTNQLSKGLIVNIYKNGGWGCYKRIIVQDIKDDFEVVEIPVLKNCSNNSNNKNLAVKYLGLNFKDSVVEEKTENEFGPLEYSGLSENNKAIMGIASFSPMATRIEYDELLSWPVPSTWSLEEASTVPLAYGMSYYVLDILCSLNKGNSILVTSGLHLIGQAAISIGLAKKCETYAIVGSSQQADRLFSLFPELSRSRILVNTDNKFDIKLKLVKSKGVDIILNFLSGEAFQVAFRTVADHGKFFHFSKYDMKNHKFIGTRIFLRNTSFTVVSSNKLLNESDINKQIVHQSFLDGLNKGVIKPFHKSVLSMPFTSGKVFDAMRNASTPGTSEKVVLSLNDDLNNSAKSRKKFECDMTYYCHPDRVYVIVGNKSDWLELAEWLGDRRAKNIVISVKRCLMSLITCRRLDKLIAKNVSIQIESDSYLNTREDTFNWLNRLTSSNDLGSLFLVNQFDDNKINNLGRAFEENPNKSISTSFVCISSRGEHICAELKSVGLNSLNISWDGISSQPKTIEGILPSLVTLLQRPNLIQSSSFVCSETGSQKLEWSQQMNEVVENYFPNSVDELNLLNDKLTKEAEFVEVVTMSPRFKHLKSASPVFVIPGFKPNLVNNLYKNMFYPTFEAQIPEDIDSIDKLSHILVNKIKSITNLGYVSLIGESWGGIVALKMAQILEAQGTLVTVSLLEGDPEILIGWTESFFSNDICTNKLNTMYSAFSREFTKYPLEKCDKKSQLSMKTHYQKISIENTRRTLNWILARLKALLESKPLSNKLHTKVSILRYERTFEFNRTNLNEYCINPPYVHIIAATDYKHMIMDKETIELVTKNVLYSYPIGTELSLSDKYKQYFFYVEKYLKC